jgi:pyridoxamine 5'-phosphate oxidase-like protein
MAKVHEVIDDRLHRFIAAQEVFFVATAPSGDGGHLNLSPKGMTGTFAVVDPLRVAYLDYLGSGAETIAHLRDNGRIVIMFCAFEGPPNVVRLHGTGRAVLPGDDDYDELLGAFDGPRMKGLRSIIDVAVTRVSDSCGFAVPLMDHVGDRDLLEKWAGRKTDAELADYARTKNQHSLDGLPALARDVSAPMATGRVSGPLAAGRVSGPLAAGHVSGPLAAG